MFLGLSSAFVQWNDPDPMVWIFAYLGLVLLAFLDLRQQGHIILTTMLLAVYLIAFLIYLPDLITWINDGMPSITKSMKAENMYIELVRESGGLLICLSTTFVYFFRQIRLGYKTKGIA
jgi:hypothetical protein